jgi:RecJ-like exonuclease
MEKCKICEGRGFVFLSYQENTAIKRKCGACNGKGFTINPEKVIKVAPKMLSEDFSSKEMSQPYMNCTGVTTIYSNWRPSNKSFWQKIKDNSWVFFWFLLYILVIIVGVLRINYFEK